MSSISKPRSNICKTFGCNKVASYGTLGFKILKCSKHSTEYMFYRPTKKCVCGCKNIGTYATTIFDTDRRCVVHKYDDDIDLTDIRCTVCNFNVCLSFRCHNCGNITVKKNETVVVSKKKPKIEKSKEYEK